MRTRARGHYQNVFLSDTELSEYMASTGKTYKNHAATIRRWAAEDRHKGGIPDYSYKEGKSL